MFQLTEFPPTIPMIFIKDYIYSSFLTIPEISQIEQEKYPLYTLAEIGIPKQLTEKQYNSLCKNYQFVEKKYWPPIIKQVDYIHCEDVINQLQEGVNENLKKKKIQRKLLQIEKTKPIDSLPQPIKSDTIIPKYSWIGIRGEELIGKTKKYKTVYWLAVFLKYVENNNNMIVIHWATKVNNKTANNHTISYFLNSKSRIVSLSTVLVWNLNVYSVFNPKKHKIYYNCNLSHQDFVRLEDNDGFHMMPISINASKQTVRRSLTSMFVESSKSEVDREVEEIKKIYQ